jgi:PhoH-like ATPase
LQKHLYILDSSTLIHDPQSLFAFKEHDIYLCLSVIDDLDKLKTSPNSVGYTAREVLRILDRINPTCKIDGIPLTPEGGQLFIYNHDAKTFSITSLHSDDGIILAAINLTKKFPEQDVIIVSKDTGLRIRAAAWNCKVENYQSDLVDTDYTGILYEDVYNIDDLAINQFIINSIGKIRQKTENGMIDIEKQKLSWVGISSKNSEQHCALSALTNMNIELVCLAGLAGSGKTLISIAAGLDQIFDGKYHKILFIKPIVPVSGRDLGALPGDKNEKLSSWYGPLRDSIDQLNIKSEKSCTFDDLVDEDIVELECLEYIQGRSIANALIIVDEAANISQREARLIVERCSKGSKVILLGDMSQIENPYLDKRSCGLAHAINGSKGKPNCAAITFKTVVRSALSAMASEIFKK